MKQYVEGIHDLEKTFGVMDCCGAPLLNPITHHVWCKNFIQIEHHWEAWELQLAKEEAIRIRDEIK